MIAADNSKTWNGVTPKEGGAVFLLLLASSFAVYAMTLSYGFLPVWDDPLYIVNNVSAHGFSLENLKAAFSRFYVGNYAPLHIVSYMLDYTFWGLNATGYSLHNILLHTANGFLLYLLLRRLFLPVAPSLVAALFFLLHPVQVESVVWLSQRKNLLAMFFFLLALLFHLRLRSEEKNATTDYVLALLFFVVSLLTKSVAVVFPLLMILYDTVVTRRRLSSAIIAALPFAAFAFAIAYITMMSQSDEYDGGGRTYYHGGNRLATFFTMLPVFATYLRMIIAPYGLSIIYAPSVRHTPDAVVLFSALLIALFAAAGYLLWRRSRLCFFWYTVIPVAILPVSQLVPLVTMMNDRYLYFPMIGVAACVGYGLAFLQTRWPTSRSAMIAVLIITGIFGVASFQRTAVWKSSLTLWQDAVNKQPASDVALRVLGNIQAASGDDVSALSNLERARGLCAGVECYHVNEALCSLYLKSGRRDLAEKSADEMLLKFPRNANGYLIKGYLKYTGNDVAQAEKLFLKGVSIDPNQPAALHALGNIYMAGGNISLAREKMFAAYRLGNPTAELNYSLAALESTAGRLENALNYLESALRLGYNRPEQLLSSRELAALRATPGFIRLMNQYFPNIQKEKKVQQ